jgi:hypothetical protein
MTAGGGEIFDLEKIPIDASYETKYFSCGHPLIRLYGPARRLPAGPLFFFTRPANRAKAVKTCFPSALHSTHRCSFFARQRQAFEQQQGLLEAAIARSSVYSEALRV